MNEHHKRILAHAVELGKPLAFRRGGGAAFGIVMPESLDDQREHVWTIAGIPKVWGPVLLREWLEKQGWSVLDTSPPRGRNRPWTFRGKNPNKVGERSFSYALKFGDEDEVYVVVKRWQKKRKADSEIKNLPGPRWWTEDATFDDPIEVESMEEDSLTKTWPVSASAAPTVLDATDEKGDAEKSQESKGEKNKGGESLGNSPPKKKAKQGKASDLDKVGDGAAGPEYKGRRSIVEDLGGAGDCGWRSLAFAVAGINNSNINEDTLRSKIPKLAKTMQGKITAYVASNKGLWSHAWVKDPNTNETMEDGAIPQSVDEYLQAIKRPHRWMDGLLLASTAVAQKVNVVVFRKKKGAWERIAVLRAGEDWKQAPVVPLILCRGHYMTLRLQRSPWPMDWVMEVEDEIPCPCSQSLDPMHDYLRAGMFETPKRRVRRNVDQNQNAEEMDEDLEHLLRTCSGGKASSAKSDLLRTCSARRASSSKSDLLRTCSVRKGSTGKKKLIDEKSHCEKAGKKKKEVGIVKKTIKEKKVIWTCPICDHVIQPEKEQDKILNRVQWHLFKNHRDEWQKHKDELAKCGRTLSTLGLRAGHKPRNFVKMSKDEIKEKAGCICPWCDLCMPKLSDVSQKQAHYLMRISKEWHFKTCLKKPVHAELSQFHVDYMKKYSEFHYASFRTRRSQGFAEKKKDRMYEIGHDPVIVDFTDWHQHRAYGHCFLVCSTCRVILRTTHRSRKCCLGKPNSSISPGISFWKEAMRRGLMDEMAEKLKMDQEEMNKVVDTLKEKADD